MKDLLILLTHLLTTIAKLLGPGGAKAVIADSLLMKQQLLVINRSRRRAPNLSALDRFLFGFWSPFLNPRCIQRAAVIIRPSTLLKFHDILKKRKYRLLYSSGSKGKPGSKGPSWELIQAIVELKQRNPRFGCPRIAQQINKAFGVDDHILIWNAQDLERKLVDFRQYYNRNRVHQSLDGDMPDDVGGVHQPLRAELSNYSWISHCNGLIQTPIAA